MKKRTLLLVVTLLMQGSVSPLLAGRTAGRDGGTRRERREAAKAREEQRAARQAAAAKKAAQEEAEAAAAALAIKEAQEAATAADAERAAERDAVQAAADAAVAAAEASADAAAVDAAGQAEQEGEAEASAGAQPADAGNTWWFGLLGGTGTDAEVAAEEAAEEEPAQAAELSKRQKVDASLASRTKFQDTDKAAVVAEIAKRETDAPYAAQKNLNALGKTLADLTETEGYAELKETIDLQARAQQREALMADIEGVDAREVLRAADTKIYVPYQGTQDPARTTVGYAPRTLAGVRHEDYVLPLAERVARASLNDPAKLIETLKAKPVEVEYAQSLSGRVVNATAALVRQINDNVDEAKQTANPETRYRLEKENLALFRQLNELGRVAAIRGLTLKATDAQLARDAHNDAFPEERSPRAQKDMKLVTKDVRVTDYDATGERTVYDTESLSFWYPGYCKVELDDVWTPQTSEVLAGLQSITKDAFHGDHKDTNTQHVRTALEELLDQLEAGLVSRYVLDSVVALVQEMIAKEVQVDRSLMVRCQAALSSQKTDVNTRFACEAADARTARDTLREGSRMVAQYQIAQFGAATDAPASETTALDRADLVGPSEFADFSGFGAGIDEVD